MMYCGERVLKPKREKGSRDHLSLNTEKVNFWLTIAGTLAIQPGRVITITLRSR